MKFDPPSPLPPKPSFAPPPGFGAAQGTPAAAAAPAAASTPHGTVLVVDDSSMTLSLIAKTLKNAGYATLLAESGVKAILTWEKNRDAIGFILSDVVMPGIDGLSLARELRKRKCTQPIALMSGRLDDDSRWIAEEAGFVLLQKPFNDADLLDLVRRLMV